MCGFNGIIGKFSPKELDHVKESSNLIKHRGPDEKTHLELENLYIDFYRLSIIDIPTGSQPMTDIDNNFTIFFNGEIYNFLALKEELIREGSEFKTNSDTEVLLEVFNKFGIKGVEKLNGMFSICLIDKKKNLTYLIRDQFGIKPLYYKQDKNIIKFSSEAKTLTQENIKIEENSLGQYLGYQFYLDNNILSSGIKTVEPGTYIEINNNTGEIKLKEYFKIKFLNNMESRTNLKDLEKTILKSVEQQVFAEVEVGTHLSGGVDSSLITAMANKFAPDLKAFHGYFPNDKKEYSEINYAREVSNFLGIELHEIEIEYLDFIENFTDIINFLDYPIVGPGVFPQYMVNKEASKHVKVLLGGQGGDEIFAGYARYLIVYLEQVLLGSITESQNSEHLVNLDTISKALPSLNEYIPLLKRMWSTELFTDTATRYELLLDRNIPKNWLTSKTNELTNNARTTFLEEMNKIKEKSLINNMLHFDIKYVLPGLLQVEDRVSMAHSIESRVPYLDQNVFNIAVNLEPKLKFGEGVLKSPLKEISKKYLPKEVHERKEKMGFPVPLNDWMEKKDFKNFVMDTITLSNFGNSKYFNKKEFEKDVTVFDTFDRSIWAILCLSVWSNKHSNN
tara:strand:+ start:3421 stop:5280 length:1860 start_codon:yes stop_codon:yes gene_type:complete